MLSMSISGFLSRFLLFIRAITGRQVERFFRFPVILPLQ